MLKETLRDDSAVEKIFTGRETSPKAMVDVPIARAAIVGKHMFRIAGAATKNLHRSPSPVCGPWAGRLCLVVWIETHDGEVIVGISGWATTGSKGRAT